VSVAELAATVVQAVVERSGLPPEVIDDVVLGQGYPSGEAPALGRVAALDAGLPVGVPGFQLDRRCGSGLQAVLVAAMEVQTGAAEVVLAGGADSMSQVEYYSTATRWGARAGHVELRDRLAQARVAAGGRRYVIPGGMIETAENLRRRYRIPRERQDRLALRSHQRAVAAQRAGWFDQEIVPVTVRGRRGETVVSQDEHPRPDTTLEALAALRPVMAREDPEATVTAGNASGQNDGAACVVVTHPARAAELGLRPLARLRSWAVAGVDPAEMGLGPVPATAKALAKAGLGLADCDRIELNEAFAAQVLAVTTEWGLDEEDERLNPLGSGIALGHPIGATGARILVTLLHELQRRDLTIGLETMCIGGGQGIAAVIERVG
jgi:acetyl-CoA C-acetyltransferase